MVEKQIIIFSEETHYKQQNIQIIEEIKKELNVSLYNNRVILNTIDICEKRERTIFLCMDFFVINMKSEIFNIFNNVFVHLNSLKFKNEMLI